MGAGNDAHKSKPTDLGLGAELLMTGLPWVIVVLAI